VGPRTKERSPIIKRIIQEEELPTDDGSEEELDADNDEDDEDDE
jgi:hypothetical protein